MRAGSAGAYASGPQRRKHPGFCHGDQSDAGLAGAVGLDHMEQRCASFVPASPAVEGLTRDTQVPRRVVHAEQPSSEANVFHARTPFVNCPAAIAGRSKDTTPD